MKSNSAALRYYVWMYREKPLIVHTVRMGLTIEEAEQIEEWYRSQEFPFMVFISPVG